MKKSSSEEHAKRAEFASQMTGGLQSTLSKTTAKVRELMERAEMHKISAQIVALAKEMELEKERMSSQYDDLTKLLRRGAFLDKINKYLFEKLPSKSTVVFFDIDKFKSVNDTYGHEAGDEALIELASAIQNFVKDKFGEQAIVGRWGGEEMVVFIPGKSSEDVLDTFKSANTNQEAKFNHQYTSTKVPNYSPKLTVSGGITDFKHNENVVEAITRADAGMYYQKKKPNGRDGIVIYDNSMQEFLNELKAKEEKAKLIIVRAKKDAEEYKNTNKFQEGISLNEKAGIVARNLPNVVMTTISELNLSSEEQTVYLESFILDLAA